MVSRRSSVILLAAVVGAVVGSPLHANTHGRHTQDPSAPRILLDQPLRAVEYQLGRLTNEELVLVERKDSDVKYRPVYLALLSRKGLPPQFRDEAVAAITKIDKSNPSRVIFEALAKVPVDDTVTGEKLMAMLLARPAAELAGEREAFAKAADTASEPVVVRAAYVTLMVIDGAPDKAWQAALAHDGHLGELLRGVPLLPAAGKPAEIRQQLFTPVAALTKETTDPAVRAAAFGALGWTRRDAATFDLLAQEVTKGADAESRSAAIESLQAIPEDAWPAASVEPLARAILAKVGELPADGRTEPEALDLIQFGERLAAKLPGDAGRGVRRDLRTLGVRVVRIQALPEKLSFDVKWFAVEAAKPVQIMLVNADAMPHNLLVSKPGSLEQVGTAGGAMPMPSDPAATKAFVPDSPLVLHATRLVKEGETERLGFTAPKEPGEYIFVCTFPGHWVRMYGVMLVVEQLDAWEAKPTVPIDPMTKQPFTAQRN